MMLAVFLFLIGLSLSAFFSGCETGFYRVTRWRLVLESREGDAIARGLLWLTNYPSVFVATTLIGNNLANYLVSLSIVLGTHSLLASDSLWPGLLAAVAMSPLVYVYGEALPKSLFFYAPNLLLRRSGLIFLFCTVVFAPLAAVLWAFARLLQMLSGEAPERVRTIIARRELERVLEEGHASGLLRPIQRVLAQSIFSAIHLPVTRMMTPVKGSLVASSDLSREEILSLGEQNQTAAVPLHRTEENRFSEYVLMSDLAIDQSSNGLPARPLLSVTPETTYLDALLQMQSGGFEMACVVDTSGAAIGFLQTRVLVEGLLSGDWS